MRKSVIIAALAGGIALCASAIAITSTISQQSTSASSVNASGDATSASPPTPQGSSTNSEATSAVKLLPSTGKQITLPICRLNALNNHQLSCDCSSGVLTTTAKGDVATIECAPVK